MASSMTVTIVCALLAATATSFSAAPNPGRHTVALSASPFGSITVGVSPVRTEKELCEVSAFFVDNFFLGAEGRGGGGDDGGDVWERVRSQLESDQQADWRARFSITGTNKAAAARLGAGAVSDDRAMLLVAREITGQIVGCASVGVAPWGAFGSNGARFDPNARKNALDPNAANAAPKRVRDKSEAVPVLANLVVARSARRRGIGAKLAAKALAVAKNQWGFAEVALAVESSNAPAIKLYRTLGYSDIWTDVKATKLVASPGGVRSTKTTNLVMAKSTVKKGGLFAR